MKDHFVTAKQSAQQNKPFFAAWINTFVSLACLQDSADFSPIDKRTKNLCWKKPQQILLAHRLLVANTKPLLPHKFIVKFHQKSNKKYFSQMKQMKEADSKLAPR